jgi:hypothetical protein
METSPAPIQRDSRLNIWPAREFLDGSEIGGSNIGRWEESNWNLAGREFVKCAFEPLPPAQLDEAYDHKYAIGSCHFAFKFKASDGPVRFVAGGRNMPCF